MLFLLENACGYRNYYFYHLTKAYHESLALVAPLVSLFFGRFFASESCPEQELVGFNYQADYASLAFTANCGDFAPTFVNDNIGTVFGYAPAEYLENPSFWRDRVLRKQHSVVRH